MQIQVSLMVEIDASAELAGMEEQIQEAGHQAMRQALQQAVRHWERQHRSCPQCGSQQVRLEGTVARSVQALFGAVRLARQRLRCQDCLRRFCPANRLLASMQRGRVSPALREAATLAGCSWPYRQAASMLGRLCGAQISAEEIRLLTNRTGRELARKQEQAVSEESSQEGCCEEADQPGAREERTIIALDGGWVPSREQRGGMEGKVAVVVRGKEVLREASRPSGEMTWIELERYTRRHWHPSVKRSRYRHHRYAATFASAAVLGRQAAAAVQHVGRASSEQVVVADGASWITHANAGALCRGHLYSRLAACVANDAQSGACGGRAARREASLDQAATGEVG